MVPSDFSVLAKWLGVPGWVVDLFKGIDISSKEKMKVTLKTTFVRLAGGVALLGRSGLTTPCHCRRRPNRAPG